MDHIFSIFFVFLTAVRWSFSAENLVMNQLFMHGYIFPASVTVAVGESVHLKIMIPMNDDDRCLYREPGSAEDIDVHAPVTLQARAFPVNVSDESHPLFVDANECGIKVLNINHQDAGFWRLTMVRGTTLIRGISMVNVIDVPTVPDNSDRDSITGLEEITPEGTDYCYVMRDPENQNRGVPMYEQCSLEVTELDPTASGRWNVIAGVQGHMREMHFAINIEHKEEQILTSIYRNTDYQVLMCSLRYSRQMVKFCRFVRLADNLGLNMLEGVGWDRYRYYGNGFMGGDCGLEIDEPDTIDRGLWKCVIGYGDDTVMKVSGAILDTREPEAEFSIINVENVNTLNGTEMALQCNANKPLDYCWFRNPSGMIYSVSENLIQDDSTYFWYDGTSLTMGDCGIRLKPVSMEMSGRWSCHVGSSKFSALEVSAFINVRVSYSQMIGSSDQILATVDTALILECSSIPKNTPLEYCRFVTPRGPAFSLDESINSDKAILGNYYSNPSHDPKKGFCSLVIKSVSQADIGEWICAGKIAGHTMEHYTMMDVTTERSNTGELTTASIIGMAAGGATILLLAVGFGYYNFWRRLRQQVSAVNDEIELQERNSERTQATQRFSTASGSSGSSQRSQRSDSELRST